MLQALHYASKTGERGVQGLFLAPAAVVGLRVPTLKPNQEEVARARTSSPSSSSAACGLYVLLSPLQLHLPAKSLEKIVSSGSSDAVSLHQVRVCCYCVIHRLLMTLLLLGLLAGSGAVSRSSGCRGALRVHRYPHRTRIRY